MLIVVALVAAAAAALGQFRRDCIASPPPQVRLGVQMRGCGVVAKQCTRVPVHAQRTQPFISDVAVVAMIDDGVASATTLATVTRVSGCMDGCG